MTKYFLLFSIALSCWLPTTVAVGCIPEKCNDECRKLETTASKLRGHCSLLGTCECEHYSCDDSKCFQLCIRKDPERFKGGHCRWDWCKCDTQAWRRKVSEFFKLLL